MGECLTETKEYNPREAVICTLPEFVEPNERPLSWMVEEYQTGFWFLLGKSKHLSEKKKLKCYHDSPESMESEQTKKN